MASSNGDLVAAAAQMAQLAGRSVASLEETKQLLWPGGKGNW
jgi:uncharacterized protein (DUF849 family)